MHCLFQVLTVSSELSIAEGEVARALCCLVVFYRVIFAFRTGRLEGLGLGVIRRYEGPGSAEPCALQFYASPFSKQSAMFHSWRSSQEIKVN